METSEIVKSNRSEAFWFGLSCALATTKIRELKDPPQTALVRQRKKSKDFLAVLSMHVLVHKRRGGDEAISEARRGPADCRSCLMQADKVLAMTTAEGPLGRKPICKWTWCKVSNEILIGLLLVSRQKGGVVPRFCVSEATLLDYKECLWIGETH